MIPPSTTPHMPGTSRSASPFITWQVEVPMIATICPGSMACAAGAVTCASTLPTATAMPVGQPGPLGGARREAAGAVAELAERVLQLLGDEAARSRGRARGRNSGDG